MSKGVADLLRNGDADDQFERFSELMAAADRLQMHSAQIEGVRG